MRNRRCFVNTADREWDAMPRMIENRKITPEHDHPEAKKHSASARDKDVRALIAGVDDDLNRFLTDREQWENREVRWYRERYGIRTPKTFPFPGASNITLPVIDMAIRKLLPAYTGLIWEPDRVAEFDFNPDIQNLDELDQAAEVNSHLLDHLIQDRMTQSFEKSVDWTDRMLHSGFSLVKVTYEYRTRGSEVTIDLMNLDEEEQAPILQNPQMAEPDMERAVAEYFITLLRDRGTPLDLEKKDDVKSLEKNVQRFQEGASEFKFNVTTTEAHAPLWTVIKPQDVILDPGVTHAQDAELIGHRSWWTPQSLRRAAADGRFDAEAAYALLERHENKTRLKGASPEDSRTDNELDATIAEATGAGLVEGQMAGDPIELREVGLYAMPDRNGIMKRCVLVYSPDYMEKPLRFTELPYEDGKWPYVRFRYEIKTDGWYSPRGVPHILDYLATSINVQHNQKIDRQTIVNAPMLKYIPGQVSMSNIRFIPGQGVPVKSMDSLDPIVIPHNQFSFIEEERELRGYAEQYVASPDFGLTDQNQPTSKARTATEISQISAQKAQLFSLDAKIYLNPLKELLEMTWSRWMQYGPEEHTFRVVGQENPIEWKRQYGVRDMVIRPKGVLQDTNPQLKLQNALADMEVGSNEAYSPYIRLPRLLEEYFRTKDPKTAPLKMKSDEEIQEDQRRAAELQQMQIQQAQEIELTKLKLEHEFEVEELKVKGQIEIAKIKAQADADAAGRWIENKLTTNEGGENGKRKNNPETAVGR